MVQAPGIRVAASQAEATRRLLQGEGRLRLDLHPLQVDGDIAFAVDAAPETFDFRERSARPKGYTDLLPDELKSDAPRAFDTMGDIAIVKIPTEQWDHRQVLGDAMLQFLDARAVFHDRGVKGEFRVRDLERIAGDGGSETIVQENGVTLCVDVSAAYFSPRLASERARVADLVQPDEHVVDLFGGVAPFAVQAAKRGARVTCIDLNPNACDFARRNADDNHVEVDVRCGDARVVAADVDPADQVVMNLPHGAHAFLDVAKAVVRPGGTVHYHEILADDDKEARAAEVASTLDGELVFTRHVRNYSKGESHWVFDIKVPGEPMTITTVTLDLDGTLLPQTTAFAEVLQRHERGDDVAASDARFFAGEITLRECFMEQWAWFQDLTPADIHRALREAPWIADLREGIARLRNAGLSVRMLTDQPSTVTDFGSRWGLGAAISSPVTVKEGRQVAIDYQEDKLANLRSAGLDPAEVLHVGNGSNDIPLWEAGAVGFAVFASNDVASHAAVDLGTPPSFDAVVDAVLGRISG